MVYEGCDKMAKGFSDREKEVIKAKLMDAAEECWGRYGLKKTSVDELTAMANISKGSFYLFYPSKEHLFMDVFDRIDQRIKTEMFNRLQNDKGNPRENFLSVIRFLFGEAKKAPWILNMYEGDLELLIRKLPPERIGVHLSNDDSAALELFKVLEIDPGVDHRIASGSLRALFLTLLHKQEIGSDIFDDVLDYLLIALTDKLFSDVSSSDESRGAKND